MNIRYAQEDDFNFIVEGLEKTRIIEKRPEKDIKAGISDKRKIKKAIKTKNIRVLVEEEKLIGFIFFLTDYDVMLIHQKFLWIDLIFINEDFRGKGYGKLLYEDSIKIAKKLGIKKIVIDIFEANRNSLNFHKKIGFKPLYAIYYKEL